MVANAIDDTVPGETFWAGENSTNLWHGFNNRDAAMVAVSSSLTLLVGFLMVYLSYQIF